VAELQEVCKTYRLYDRPCDRLKQFLPVIGQGKRYFTEVRALEPVSLNISAGEILAIVGQNGSGKSTLLKILSGNLNPDSGRVRIHGRVAALLELGAGFNPELTGRENVRINAALLGLDADATEACLPDVQAFADVGEFFDHPVKTYSSGMFARVAFATMVSTNPELLIVDEILAVGDEPFQRKCFARIEQLARSGTAVIFVTHNTPLVTQLAHRAMLLETGRCTKYGAPRDVVQHYYRTLSLALADAPESATSQLTEASAETTSAILYDPELASDSTTEYARDGAVISDPRLLDAAGSRVNLLYRRQSYEFCYRVTLDVSVDVLECGSLIKNMAGVELGGLLANSDDGPYAAGDVLDVRIRFRCLLLPGTYFLNAGVRGDSGDEAGSLRYLHRVFDIVAFRVLPEADPEVTGMVDFSNGALSTIERARPGNTP
jgi:lipopolysaccharide transport system ATP-binding protein